MINRAGGLPIYLQIAYRLRDEILDGYYDADAKIPAEEDLASTYGVSRMTARSAVTYLVNEGLVYRIHGKGAFVSNKKLSRNLNKLTHFHQDMEEFGMKPSSQTRHFTKRFPTQKEQKSLKISKVQAVFEVEQIRYVDGDALGVQQFIVPEHIVPDLETVDLDKRPFYQYLREIGHSLERAEQRIESVLAPDIAKTISVPAENPFFYFERLTYTNNQVPIELLYSYFCGDKYAFNITLYSN